VLTQQTLKRRAHRLPDIQSPQPQYIKTLYLQCVESFQVPFFASLRGKCFSPHFPQTENGPVCVRTRTGRRGFDSRLHIKCGGDMTQVFRLRVDHSLFNCSRQFHGSANPIFEKEVPDVQAPMGNLAVSFPLGLLIKP